jgi:superfamily II DNA or RNA helicase
MITMNRLKNYEKILSEKGLSDYPYIRKFILENESFDKPFVLGAGTSSGKTFMGIIWLELFYSNTKNKGLKTLVFPASTVVLRDNFGDSLKEFNPSFTYCICEDGGDIKSAIKSNCDVIVVLPQTARVNENLFKSFHNFILDEAHQWYFEKTITSIIKKINPINQILLTGTPAPFVAKKENFDFQFVPVLELYELGKVSNVKIELISTSHNFKFSDYNNAYNLKADIDVHSNAENELNEVCKEMIKKLRNPIKGYESFNNITKNSIGSLFNFLEKTIIFCQSKKQADSFYKILSNMKALEDKVLVSHSESDRESLEFRNFKEQSKYQILIAVDRGKLGFNIPDLFNVIDFTFTQNLSMLLQMYGRLLRLSKSNKPKIFYKVAPKNMAPYFVDLITAMCSLLDYEWYSKFNGKNMDEIIIRKVSISKKRNNNTSNNNPKKLSNKLYSIEQLGIPLDLNLLTTNIKHSYDGKFVTVAETTLGKVKREFFKLRVGNRQWEYDVIKKEALKYKHTINFLNGGENNTSYYQFAKSRGWDKELFSHFTNRTKEITKEEVIEASKNCLDYSKWRTEYSGYYNKAKRIGIHDEITKHMNKLIVNRGKKLTKKECLEIALKYKRREDLKNDNSFVHSYARKMGWYNEITKHMKVGIGRNENQKRRVIQKDLNGKIINIFDSLTEAGKAFNNSGVQKVIYGKKSDYKGFTFEYEK